MEKYTKNSLYIPQGIKHKSEKFKGIPDEHIKFVVVILGVLGAIDILIWIFSQNPPAAFGAFVIEFSAVGLFFRRDENTNISIYDQIRFMSRFSKSQKKYRYKMLKEWHY